MVTTVKIIVQFALLVEPLSCGITLMWSFEGNTRLLILGVSAKDCLCTFYLCRKAFHIAIFSCRLRKGQLTQQLISFKTEIVDIVCCCVPNLKTCALIMQALSTFEN
jgi:hypothetical protein